MVAKDTAYLYGLSLSADDNAVCRNVLQCDAMYVAVCVAACCSMSQCIADGRCLHTCKQVSFCKRATSYRALLRVAVSVAVCCSVL